MTCLDETTILDMASGRLAADPLARVHRHLDRCAPCRSLVAEVARISAQPDMAEDRRVAAGERVGRYLVLARVGSGAMGVVYAAWDPDLDRRIALKVLRPDGALPADALIREARSVASVTHPNVIVVHDVGESASGFFIAMEFLDGGTLRAWLRQPRSWREIVERFIGAGRGLGAAHDAGLVHRDFKPDNVLLGRDQRLRVTDFGLAVAPDPSETASVTETCPTGGTPAYMAPEQHFGGRVDERADQFSFCVALYEALWGRRPFPGETLSELRGAIQGRQRIAYPAKPSAPVALRRIVGHGLEIDPGDRFTSMAHLVAELERCARPSRRWLIPAVGLVGVATVAAAWPDANTCRPATAWEGVWTQERDRSIRAAFVETGAPYATETWTRTAAAIETYLERWRETEKSLCVASAQGRLDKGDYEARLRCLDDRRAQVESLLDLFADATGDVVGRAIDSAWRLDPAGECGEGGRAEQLREPEKGREVADMLAELGPLDVLGRAGRAREAEARGRLLLDQARELGDPSTTARVGVRLAGAIEQSGRFDEARQLWLQVAADAIRGDDHLTAARAWLALYILDGRELGGRATSWDLLAEAAIDREDGPPRLRALLHVFRGHVQRARGDTAAATASWTEAVALLEGALPPEHPDIAKAQMGLADAHYAAGDYETALAQLESVLIRQEAAYGPMHREVGTTLTQLALALGKVGRRKEGIATFERALEVYRVALGPEHPAIGTPMGNLGAALLHDDVRDYSRALESSETALELIRAARGPTHPAVFGLRNNIGRALAGLGRRDEALAIHEEVLPAIIEAELEVHPVGLDAHLRMAEFHLEDDRADLARPHSDRAVEIAEALHPDGHPRLLEALEQQRRATDTPDRRARKSP